MEIAQSYDLESSPATCPGIPLLELCHLLPVRVDLTFSGTHLGSIGLKGKDWPLASPFLVPLWTAWGSCWSRTSCGWRP